MKDNRMGAELMWIPPQPTVDNPDFEKFDISSRVDL